MQSVPDRVPLENGQGHDSTKLIDFDTCIVHLSILCGIACVALCRALETERNLCNNPENRPQQFISTNSIESRPSSFSRASDSAHDGSLQDIRNEKSIDSRHDSIGFV